MQPDYLSLGKTLRRAPLNLSIGLPALGRKRGLFDSALSPKGFFVIFFFRSDGCSLIVLSQGLGRYILLVDAYCQKVIQSLHEAQ